MYDVNPMGGGRILRDRLWFYTTYRQTGSEQTVPGMWWNNNAGNPNAWTVDFDRSRQAFNDTVERQGTMRLTWQATPRNKINVHWSEQYNSANKKGGGSGTQTQEAHPRTLYQPSRQPHATWSSPISSRLLAEAGWGMYQARYRMPTTRVDGTHNPLMIRVQEQGGEIPNLFYRMPGGTGGGFYQNLIGTLANRLRIALDIAHSPPRWTRCPPHRRGRVPERPGSRPGRTRPRPGHAPPRRDLRDSSRTPHIPARQRAVPSPRRCRGPPR